MSRDARKGQDNKGWINFSRSGSGSALAENFACVRPDQLDASAWAFLGLDHASHPRYHTDRGIV
eukprot:scaffold5683_cov156-Amphora_coffeaeformis.AAC.3